MCDLGNGDVQSPARLPELSARSYFFSGYRKGKLCVDRSRKIAELGENIGEEVSAILM